MDEDQELSRSGGIIRKRKPSIRIQAIIDNFEGSDHIKKLAKGIDWKELLKWIKDKH